MGVLRKRPILPLALLAAVLLASCRAQPRHPDQFYIDTVADYVAHNDHTVQVVVRKPNGDTELQYHPVVPYGNGARLLAENPGCCTVGRARPSNIIPECVTWGQAVEVTMSWDRRYRTAENTIASEPDVRHFGVRDDGSVCTTDDAGFDAR